MKSSLVINKKYGNISFSNYYKGIPIVVFYREVFSGVYK